MTLHIVVDIFARKPNRVQSSSSNLPRGKTNIRSRSFTVGDGDFGAIKVYCLVCVCVCVCVRACGRVCVCMMLIGPVALYVNDRL